MLQPKQPMRWLWAVLIVVALAAPALATAAPDTPSDARRAWRVPATHGPDERLDKSSRVQAWAEDYIAHAEQRPPVDPAQQSQTVAQWTVMVFIAADNDIEGASLFDINEMELVGSSPDVNVVVQIDRSADYSDVEGDWSDTRRYYIQQDENFDVITTPVLETIGEIDSGSAESVADFATWAITSYPAQKYMLVLWDHAGAWATHLSDEQAGSDSTLPELSAALDRVKAQTGIDKFEVIGFDMCLMGQLEVFQTIAPYARYGVGSEESEPGPGWFYVFLEDLVNNPAMTGADITPLIVDAFMYFFVDILEMDDVYGLSAVNLSQASTVTNALGGFSAAVQANPEAVLSALADARNNTVSYGGWDDPRYYDVWSSVDLYRFMELLNDLSTLPEVQGAAQGVMQAVNSFVIYEKHHEWLDNSHGVAIYFPINLAAYTLADFNLRYPVEVPGAMAPWIEFLNVFHGTSGDVVTKPVVAVLNVYPDVGSIHQPAVVTMEVSGRDIVQVTYAVTYVQSENQRIVLDYDYLVSRTATATGADIVDWSNGVTTRTFTWEAEVPMLSDGTVSTYALLIPNRDNPNIAVVNGQYLSMRGGDPVEAQLVFDLNQQRSTALWGINETASGSLQPYQIQVEQGDRFQPLWLTLDANNDLVDTSLGNTLTLTNEQSISFEKVPAPSGTYAISFVAQNVAGQETRSETIIQVNNEGLDATLRGYTDLTYGVNFLYPADWIRPRFMPDGKRLYTGDEPTGTALALFPYTNVASAAQTYDAVRQDWSDLENLQITQEREVTLNGLPAYVTDYTYTYQGQARKAAVIAIYVPSQNVGYGFDIDAPADNPDPAIRALQALLDSINFFEVSQAEGQSAWQTVSLAEGRVSFPVPTTWVQETQGNWTLFRAPDNPVIFIALGATPASGQTKEAIAQAWVTELQNTETNLQILASQPYYVGNEEWYLVVFTYDDVVKMAGAFFATTVGGEDYVFWLEAPDAEFDQLYNDIFSAAVDGFAFGG
jgi:hypothetical protein